MAVIIILLVAFILNKIIDGVISRTIRHKRKKNVTTLLMFIKRIKKFVIYALAILVCLTQFDVFNSFSVTILSGLGIGSVVVGLAAQESLKNFFGSVAIVLGNPYEVGDFIECVDKAVSGTVEDITMRHTIIRTINNRRVIIPNCEMNTYTIENFNKYATTVITEILNELLGSKLCPEGFLQLFIKSLYNIIVSTVHVYLINTEIIFWGYGEDDIFPSYVSFVISSAFDGRIKYTNKSEYIVSNINNACVEPFAQTDVANTVIRGIDDDLRQKFYESYNESITVLRDEIISQLDSAGAPDALKDALHNIDLKQYTDLYMQGMNQYIQENYIMKLVNTISYLSKEDLADMAESLVRMTYLKRRITSEEESVGGPVDVAVITKGDGFVWLKRKHYFPAELNPHYFERSKLK